MIEMSFTYAKQYEKDGKLFIKSFIENPSIRTACAFIVKAYKQTGAFSECEEFAPDFTDYVSRLPIPDRWRRVLGEILQIIYSIIKK